VAILHTHRRGLMLLERARVHLAEGRVVHADAEGDAPVSRSWNIPSLNSAAVILGQGCSISQPAARRLADDGVLLAFAGTSGTPLICASQDYRPSAALQAWIVAWPDPAWRLRAALHLQRARIEAIRLSWAALASAGFKASPAAALNSYEAALDRVRDVSELTAHEGVCTRSLYVEAARATGITWNGRVHQDASDRPNHFLDHGNYLAYGLGGTAIWARGIPPSLPVVHGRSNAGGLVFDLADVVKDALILPTAFQCAADLSLKGAAVRQRIVTALYDATWLDPNGAVGLLFRVLEELIASTDGRATIGAAGNP
jgi:CRISPR-associated protein Cas1